MAARRSRRITKQVFQAQVPPKLPAWHALLTPLIAHALGELGISVSLWVSGDWWYPISVASGVSLFEFEHGVVSRRWAYNRSCFEQVEKTKKAVLGTHAGFRDLFTPVRDGSELRGILVAGTFASARPTSAKVIENWYELTGAQGHVGDPGFSRYLSATMATLTLDAAVLEAFERLMSCFAGLLAGRGSPEARANEAESLRRKVSEARFSERMWKVARELVDERMSRNWAEHGQGEMWSLGVDQMPQHAMVALLRSRDDEPDPIDDLLRRDAYHRACADLARRAGQVVCGQVGDHGVSFLLNHPGSGPRTRTAMTDLAARATSLAKRFGFKLHVGISLEQDSAALPARYRAALWAAEKALSQNVSLVHGEPYAERSKELLRTLRSELGKAISEQPQLLLPRFDRYIEAVLAHSGYRLETTRSELDAGFERLTEPLIGGGFLDKKSFSDLYASIEQGSSSARTVSDLVSLYRTVASDIASMLGSPTAARQERSTRRAVAFMREHVAEHLTLPRVARAAGFAPDYFSRIFKRGEGVTFEQCLRNLRIARAKQLLIGTELAVERIGPLSGFRDRRYFYRVFKRTAGVTPHTYREQGGRS